MKNKVSRVLLPVALLAAGLLAPEQAGDAPLPAEAEPQSEILARRGHAVDAGNCHGPRRELRFAWLKPGEEPLTPTGPTSVCLAVYEVPGREL
jgi:hypothetical protein